MTKGKIQNELKKMGIYRMEDGRKFHEVRYPEVVNFYARVKAEN